MISLSGGFWIRPHRRWESFLVIVALLATSGQALAECNPSPVFIFSRALYMQQYPAAAEQITRIRSERGSEMAAFLQQVLDFSRAYQRGDKAGVRAALKALDALIDSFPGHEASGIVDDRVRKQASIRIHAARMHLLSGNLLRAVALSKAAAPVLNGSHGEAVSPDALLALGLYQYYAGRGDDDLGWVISLFGFEGDKLAGLENIRQAAEWSPDSAFEAVRSLVWDMGWNRQQLCPVIGGFAHATADEHPDPTHYQQLIAAFLFCGDPLQALALIKRSEQEASRRSTGLNRDQREWLYDARLHTFAVLGDTLSIEEMLAQTPMEQAGRRTRIRFALARALDLQAQHDQARDLYRALLDEELAPAYQRLARAYLEHGFRAPEPYQDTMALPLLTACRDPDGEVNTKSPG